MNKFWLVWSPKNGKPTVQHLNYEEAKVEAMRLAVKHPGFDFFVLECKGVAIIEAKADWKDI